MRAIPFAGSVVIVLLMLASCDAGSFQGELAPCPCEGGGCTTAACPITVTLDSTCVGEMAFAEVLVGNHVEAGRLVPLQALETCSKIEPGAEAVLWVRGGPWIWGPLVEHCATAGETRAIVLQCVAAQSQ